MRLIGGCGAGLGGGRVIATQMRRTRSRSSNHEEATWKRDLAAMVTQLQAAGIEVKVDCCSVDSPELDPAVLGSPRGSPVARNRLS
jgi:hypothetical protein